MLEVENRTLVDKPQRHPVAANLSARCAEHEEFVSEQVLAALTHFHPSARSIVMSDGILRTAMMCEMANSCLGLLLTEDGYSASLLKRDFPSSEILRPTTDHALLSVTHEDELFIVDANYYPFVRCLGLREREMPCANVLVTPYSELDSLCESLARLRERNPSEELIVWSYSFMNIDGKEPHPIKIDSKGLAEGFSQLWDIQSDDYREVYSPQQFSEALLQVASAEVNSFVKFFRQAPRYR